MGGGDREPFKVLSLFAGIGGFDLGLERTGGFRTIAFAETDPYASRVLAKHWPGVPNLGDVEKAEYPDADFICAGFPCQDISYAGEGAGLAGARSGLWREVVRALRVVRPRGALLENVAALLNRGMGTVLGDLAEVGYDAEWHCIPASAVGAPHRRDRIWIACHADREGEPACALHDEASGLPRDPLSGILEAALADAAPVLRASILGGEPDGNHAGAGEVADAASVGRRQGRARRTFAQGQEREAAGTDVANAEGDGGDGVGEAREARRCTTRGRDSGPNTNHWRTEPDVGRVAHGVPARVDRLRSLGNAVVPQIPELIGRAILQAGVR